MRLLQHNVIFIIVKHNRYAVLIWNFVLTYFLKNSQIWWQNSGQAAIHSHFLGPRTFTQKSHGRGLHRLLLYFSLHFVYNVNPTGKCSLKVPTVSFILKRKIDCQYFLSSKYLTLSMIALPMISWTFKTYLIIFYHHKYPCLYLFYGQGQPLK